MGEQKEDWQRNSKCHSVKKHVRRVSNKVLSMERSSLNANNTAFLKRPQSKINNGSNNRGLLCHGNLVYIQGSAAQKMSTA